MHPFHPAVRHGAPNQQQFLVADRGKLFSNALHRTVGLLEPPAHAVVVPAADGHIALVAPQPCQVFEASLQGGFAKALPVLAGLRLRLLIEQLAHGRFGEMAAHRIQQAKGEAAAAIGELGPSFVGEAPAVAGTPRAAGIAAGADQAAVGEGAQVPPHGLNGNAHGIGKGASVLLPALQQQGEHGVAGAGGGRGAHEEAKPPHTMPSNCLGMSAVLRVTMGSPLTGGLLA